MCCETCAHFVRCENNAEISVLCCERCHDYPSCAGKNNDAKRDEMDEIGDES